MIDALLHLTDAAPAPEQSYIGLIITGIVTITVAIVGAIASKARRKDEHTTPAPNEAEPQWIKDLRKDLIATRRREEAANRKVTALQRICMIYDIDPDTGRRLPNATEAFPEDPAP